MHRRAGSKTGLPWPHRGRRPFACGLLAYRAYLAGTRMARPSCRRACACRHV